MRRLDSYLLFAFFGSFFPIFLTLFTISSIASIIKLADITAIVKLGAVDFFRLYAYAIPQLFFYSLPISFFVALTLSISRLSHDGEMTAIMALGSSRASVLKPFVYLASIFSAILLFLGLVGTIMCTNEGKSFVESKKASSKLNLQANSVGQKFGDWYVFALKENSGGNYNDIVLYSKEFKSQFFEQSPTGADKIIFAKDAAVLDEGGVAALALKKGSALFVEENSTVGKIQKIEFEKMMLRDERVSSHSDESSVAQYWLKGLDDKKRAKDFADVVLTSLAPLLNLLLAFSFATVKTRSVKNSAIAYSIGSIALFYLLILSISPLITFYAIPVMVALWAVFVFFVYKNSVFIRL